MTLISCIHIGLNEMKHCILFSFPLKFFWYLFAAKGNDDMPKYSQKSQEKVERAMREMKEGKLKSGRSGKKVTNPKQAIAIGLSEARASGAKVPKKNK